ALPISWALLLPTDVFSCLSSGTEVPCMIKRRDPGTGFLDLRLVERGGYDARVSPGFGEDFTPWVDDEAVAISFPAVFMTAALRRRNDEASGLDRARPQKNVPVGFAGDAGESGGYGSDRCTVQGELSIEV